MNTNVSKQPEKQLIDIFEGKIVAIWRSKEDKTICLRVGPMTLTIENRDEKRVLRELILALDKYQETRLN